MSRHVSSLPAHTGATSTTSSNVKNHNNNFANYPAVTCAIATAIFTNILFTGVAFADEYGREVEAPTLLTGETVEVGLLIGSL
jgi:hypothetical protein